MAAATFPLRLLRCVIAPLLLLVICVHALTPLGEPVGRRMGSAFSAETVDVSLRSGQRSIVIKQAEVPKPPVALPAPVELPPVAAIVPAPAVPMPGLGPTGPPAADTSFSPLSARAPPAA